MSDQELNWEEAKERLDEVRQAYFEIGSAGLFGLRLNIDPLLVRYDRGERTQALYDDIMELKL